MTRNAKIGKLARAQAAAQSALRVPPHSEEAEKGLIGSILNLPNETLAMCADKCSPNYFFIPGHQTIYSALSRMHEGRQKIDIITVTQFMRDEGTLETVGGAVYLTELSTFVPTAAAWEHYLDIVRRKYIRRQIIAQCTELVRQAYEENIEEHELLDTAQSTLTAMIMDTERTEVFRHVREGVAVAIEQLDHAYRHRGQAAISGLATGIIDFDRMTSGLQKQNLIIVAARPSQGKTALAMNFAANIAVTNKVPVAVFSMEMSFQDITNRLVCSHAGVSLQRFRDGFLSAKNFDIDGLPKVGGEISEAPLWIDDSAALSIASFRARARLLRTRFGVKVIIVDYLQLMRSPTKRAQDARWLEITEISGALKATAKELDIPIICCAQLNREAEQREFGKPKMADLRESGSIEQDADIVALLWRPERHLENYGQREKLAKKLKLDFEEEDLAERDRQINEYAELIVAKQRNGPVGEIRLRFVSDLTKFENVTKKSWSNNPNERQTTN